MHTSRPWKLVRSLPRHTESLKGRGKSAATSGATEASAGVSPDSWACGRVRHAAGEPPAALTPPPRRGPREAQQDRGRGAGRPQARRAGCRGGAGTGPLSGRLPPTPRFR